MHVVQRLLVRCGPGRSEGGPLRVGRERGALFQDQALELLQPKLGHQELDAGAVAVLLLAQAGEDARDGLRDGQQSVSGRNSSNTLAWYGTVPRPPPTYSVKPRCCAPSAPVRTAATAPMSCMCTRPQASPAQPEKATLNLRPKSCVSGWPSRKVASASAYGVTSKVSVRQTPAIGQAVTLRTTLPQASRVVMPTAANRRMSAGVSSMWMKWQLEVLARGDVGDAVGVFLGQLGHDLELARVEAAKRHFDALHPRRVPGGGGPFGQVARRILNLARLDAVVALAVVIALAVHAAPQPRLRKQLLVELALFAQLDLGIEDVDLLRQVGGHHVQQFFSPGCVANLHGSTPRWTAKAFKLSVRQ
jgi:hypothetical protein